MALDITIGNTGFTQLGHTPTIPGTRWYSDGYTTTWFYDPDGSGLLGIYDSTASTTYNEIYLNEVFVDYGSGIEHTIEVNAAGFTGATVGVYFGTNFAGNITGVGTSTFTTFATGNNNLSFGLSGWIIHLDLVEIKL